MRKLRLWELLLRHRDPFAAAVPIAGDLNPESARGLGNFPIWAFHGERDELVSNEATRKVAALMKQLGGVFRYTEFPGVGHDSWQGAFAEPGLMPWLLAQRR